MMSEDESGGSSSGSDSDSGGAMTSSRTVQISGVSLDDVLLRILQAVRRPASLSFAKQTTSPILVDLRGLWAGTFEPDDIELVEITEEKLGTFLCRKVAGEGQVLAGEVLMEMNYRLVEEKQSTPSQPSTRGTIFKQVFQECHGQFSGRKGLSRCRWVAGSVQVEDANHFAFTFRGFKRVEFSRLKDICVEPHSSLIPTSS